MPLRNLATTASKSLTARSRGSRSSGGWGQGQQRLRGQPHAKVALGDALVVETSSAKAQATDLRVPTAKSRARRVEDVGSPGVGVERRLVHNHRPRGNAGADEVDQDFGASVEPAEHFRESTELARAYANARWAYVATEAVSVTITLIGVPFAARVWNTRYRA